VFEQFESDGYRFDASQTTDPLQPVYTRWFNRLIEILLYPIL
jgi:hypothetical protein